MLDAEKRKAIEAIVKDYVDLLKDFSKGFRELKERYNGKHFCMKEEDLEEAKRIILEKLSHADIQPELKTYLLHQARLIFIGKLPIYI